MPLKSFMICMTPIVRMTQKNNKKKEITVLRVHTRAVRGKQSKRSVNVFHTFALPYLVCNKRVSNRNASKDNVVGLQEKSVLQSTHMNQEVYIR